MSSILSAQEEGFVKENTTKTGGVSVMSSLKSWMDLQTPGGICERTGFPSLPYLKSFLLKASILILLQPTF